MKLTIEQELEFYKNEVTYLRNTLYALRKMYIKTSKTIKDTKTEKAKLKTIEKSIAICSDEPYSIPMFREGNDARPKI